MTGGLTVHMFAAAAPVDIAWVFIELGVAVLGLATLARIAHRFGFSAIPLYLIGGLAFGNGGLDTNNSELFFALNPVHILDGGFTIIGQCDSVSVAILDHIAHIQRDGSNRPVPPVIIRRIVIQP